MSDVPDLGKEASVVIDRETEAPTTLQFGRSGEGMRSLDDEFEGDPERPESMVDEFNIVSQWTLHVALYALQNPSPENLRKALSMIGTSGDCEEHIDHETLRPLPVPEPPGWDDPLWVHDDGPTQPEPSQDSGGGERLTLKVVVSGAPFEVGINRVQPIAALIDAALLGAGIKRRDDIDAWYVRTGQGVVLESLAAVQDGATLFLDPEAGGGANGASQSADPPKNDPDRPESGQNAASHPTKETYTREQLLSGEAVEALARSTWNVNGRLKGEPDWGPNFPRDRDTWMDEARRDLTAALDTIDKGKEG